MIKDSTRQKLRDAAIRNKLGGARYQNRKYYTDRELTELYNIYLNNDDKLLSLFNKEKIFKNKESWLNDLSRNLDKESRRKFVVLLNDKCCKSCGIKIGLENYSKSAASIGQYCVVCTDKKIWARKEFIDPNILIERTAKAAKSRIEFFNTPEGEIVKKNIGRKNKANMIAFNKTDRGKQNIKNSVEKTSISMKNKIANGEFTPKITNSYTHWNAEIILNGIAKKFRSSWEACFWVCNQHLSYETLRIQYFDDKNEKHTYIADFYDESTNTLYEIKPKSSYNIQIDKMNKIINHCIDTGIQFVWINEDNIWQWIDESKFDINNIPQLNKLKGKRRERIKN